MVVVPVCREQVAYAMRRRLSQRRLCPRLRVALGNRLPPKEGSERCAIAGARY